MPATKTRQVSSRSSSTTKVISEEIVKAMEERIHTDRTIGDCAQWTSKCQCSRRDSFSFKHELNKKGKGTRRRLRSPSNETRRHSTGDEKEIQRERTQRYQSVRKVKKRSDATQIPMLLPQIQKVAIEGTQAKPV